MCLCKVLQLSGLCKLYIEGKTGTGPALRSKPSGFRFGLQAAVLPRRYEGGVIFDMLVAKAKCKANLHVIYKLYDVVK